MENPQLKSARLTLRPLTPSDIDAVHALWTDSDVRRYLWDNEVIPRETTQKVLEASERDFASHRYGLWGIHLHDQAELVGFVGLRPAGGFTPEVELLYGLFPTHWHQGIAVESARSVLAYALGERRLSVVDAATDVPNVSSARVLERLGMQLIRREAVDGLDTVFYRITAEQFANEAETGLTNPSTQRRKVAKGKEDKD